MHVKLHAPLAHAACAWATVVVHALPHPSQSVALLAVLTHVVPHAVGVSAGQAVAHAYVPPELPHTGVVPVHAVLHPPQVAACERSVSQPSSAVPLQSAHPGAHAAAAKAHAPAVHEAEPLTCARFVQSLPHAPQLWTSLGTHAAPHTKPGGGHDPRPVASSPSSEESRYAPSGAEEDVGPASVMPRPVGPSVPAPTFGDEPSSPPGAVESEDSPA